jgi:hypothetical protein
VNLIANYDAKRTFNKPGVVINRFGEARFNQLFYLTDNAHYGSISARAYHNSALGLYLEDSVGFGGGILRAGTVVAGKLPPSLQLDADLRFMNERFYHVPGSRKLVGALVSERFSTSLPKGAKFEETMQLFPAFNDLHAWQGRGQMKVQYPLTEKFSLSTDLWDDYIANAPKAFRKNYLRLSLGVQFTPKP